MTTPIRILIADDHRLARDVFRLILHAAPAPAFEVIAEVDNGTDAVTTAAAYHPDIVLMDISLPGLNGIDATRQIISQQNAKVVVISMHHSRNIVLEALRAGASAYVLKDDSTMELLRALRLAQQGLCHISPRVTRLMVDHCLQHDSAIETSIYQLLSEREREVLRLLAEGQTAKQIARTLGLSGKTIETHRHRIMDRLHVESIADLTKYALREGLVTAGV